MLNLWDLRDIIDYDYTDFVNLLRSIGYFFVTADYSKFALGWF